MLKERRTQRVVGLFLIWILVMLPYYQVLADKPDLEALKAQMKPAAVDAESKSTAEKTKPTVVPQLLKMAKSAEVTPQKTSTYIVRLESPPVSRYEGGINNLKPTSPLVTKQTKLDSTNSESRAYIDYLKLEQATAVKKISQVIGRQPKISHEYRLAMNGMAVDLTLDEAMAVAQNQLSEVEFANAWQIGRSLTLEQVFEIALNTD